MWNLAPCIRNILLYEISFRSVLAKNKPYSRKNLVSENHIRGRQCRMVPLLYRRVEKVSKWGNVSLSGHVQSLLSHVHWNPSRIIVWIPEIMYPSYQHVATGCYFVSKHARLPSNPILDLSS